MSGNGKRKANPRTTPGDLLIPLSTSIPLYAMRRLKKLKEDEGISPAMFARRAILLYLRQLGEPK